MRTIEEIRLEKLSIEQELYRLKNELSIEEIKNVEKAIYDVLQQKIEDLQKEINSDTLFIKNIYNQLLELKTNAEFLVREKNDIQSIDVAEKVHKAFLMLVEYNKKLDEKIYMQKSLIKQKQDLIERAPNNSNIDNYKYYISYGQEILSKLNNELKEAEEKHSVSVEAKNRVVNELQAYQQKYEQKIQLLDDNIKKNEAQISALSVNGEKCRCGTKMRLTLNSSTKDVFWGCPNFKKEGFHSSERYYGNKEIPRKILEDIKGAEKEKDEIKPPVVSLEEEEREALQNTSIAIDEYPNIVENNICKNYLFQSLAVPNNDLLKEYFDELLEYSRFRIFTELPQENKLSEKVRTVFSLALRLMNRGVVLPSYQKTEAKIKRFFGQNNQSLLSSLSDYISYRAPQNKYDSDTEKRFAEYYFPKLLGESWATYVYTQMPIETLVKSAKEYKDQRVDFFVCYGNKKIVIELDGEEHKYKKQADKARDDKLESNHYKVIRFTNKEAKENPSIVINTLKSVLKSRNKGSLVDFSEKHLVACKVVHQTAIAIIKMLEEGHISTNCNLNLEISSSIFTKEETKLLLLLATEEVVELVKKFSELYGVDIVLNLFDETAEKYFIKIGDGDNSRNTIVIRDIVLPLNYLCSIHKFALISPDKASIKEEVLEFFLQYVYGYAHFRDGQFRAIRRTLRGEESIVLLPTGSGKSIIYQLCSMLLPGITIVISPLRALIEDQVVNLAERGVNNIAAIYSIDDENSKEEMLKKASAIMNNHSAMMLYIAPERMQMPSFRKEIGLQLQSNNFCMIAIDEAHCVSEWGHDFRAPYLQIGRSCRKVFRKGDFVPPILALTGTASDNVLRDVKRDLEILNDDAIVSPPTFDRPELSFSIIPCSTEEKFKYVSQLLDEGLPSKFDIDPKTFKKIDGKKTMAGIIFTPLARKTGSIYSAWDLFLRLNSQSKGLQIGTYFSSTPYSLTTEQDEKRDEIWQSMIKSYAKEFKDNQKQLLVATKAFGMGIDKSNIRYVIHYGLSSSIEQYYQEVGRAGRDRDKAKCVMLFSNVNKNNEFVINPNIDWHSFNETYEQYYSNGEDKDDLSPILYFHSNNFKGTDFEKSILYDVLDLLERKTKTFEFGLKCNVNLLDLYDRFSYKRSTKKTSYENFKNNIAKAIIRLSTLGVIQDYEFDYSQKEYEIIIGSIERDSVLKNYLNFVDGCSRGRTESERMQLEKNSSDNLEFLKVVVDKYIDLVYETIEKGRRRAIQSMYRLAKEASKISDLDEQDKYIRDGIQNYLVKDDVVDIVQSSNVFAGIYEILRAYPLYPEDVIIDGIERENSKKTGGYAARALESNPYHTGLLYLKSITSIKSGSYDNREVISDILEAYENSEKYSIPRHISVEFLIKVINLTFNSSTQLFEELWDKMDNKTKKDVMSVVFELNKNDISQDFKDYLQLHFVAENLKRMVGNIYDGK